MIVYACDIGSVLRVNFAWCRVDSEGARSSPDIDALVGSLRLSLNSDQRIALGFEAPLFLPVPSSSKDLNRGRKGEASRSCMAPAGLTVAGMALQQSAFIFDQLGPGFHFTFDARLWKPGTLLIWEAFISGSEKGDTHMDDARIAAEHFWNNVESLDSFRAIHCERPISMVLAAANWAGWHFDGGSEDCLVVKPESRT